MAKVTKKVDVKAVEKAKVMEMVAAALREHGYEVKDGVDYGMTKGTLIVETEVCDVQIKPVVPKAGIVRYEVEVEATEGE